MTLKSKIIGLSLALALGGTAIGCGSNSDVPDEGVAEQPQYRSTASGEDDPNKAVPAQGEAQPGNDEPVRATGPVATVNGQEITAQEFNTEVDRLLESGQFPPELLQHLQAQIIERLIDQRLIDAAIADANIEISEAEIDAKLEEVRAEFAEASEEIYGEKRTLDDMVTELGISTAELRQSIQQSIAIERLLEARGMTGPTEEEVREFYDQNQEFFAQPEQIEARHILIRVEPEAPEEAWEEARERAEQVHAQVTEEGADFEAIATEVSEGPSAPEGGALGTFARGRMVPEFEEAAFALQPGEISEPVRTQFGWHIIQVQDRQQEGTVEFDEIKDQLERELKNQAIQEQLGAFLEGLRAQADIQIHSENIQ
ncbi:MAG: peptidylprolyl isomerase [Bradymonadaceae bacterium]